MVVVAFGQSGNVPDLIHDFTRRQVAQQFELSSGAKRARQAAPHLAADAGCHPVLGGNQDALDHFARLDRKGAFDRAILADLLFFCPNGRQNELGFQSRDGSPVASWSCLPNWLAPLAQIQSAICLPRKAGCPSCTAADFSPSSSRLLMSLLAAMLTRR